MMMMVNQMPCHMETFHDSLYQIKQIQELSAKNDALETRVKELESK